jgi:phospholipid transport system transporter-binding protein
VREEAAAPVELTESAPGQFLVRGPLTFATARLARERGLAVFGSASSRDLQVDCSGITASDSAGMTVLLDWLSCAKQHGRSLHYGNLPEQVQAVAHISDALELLEKGV